MLFFCSNQFKSVCGVFFYCFIFINININIIIIINCIVWFCMCVKPPGLTMSRPFPQFSIRSDDGGARLSVQALISELEKGMTGRGSNHMNITGMNLAVVRTLLNHINRLEDRVDMLEGMIGSERPNKRARRDDTSERD
jgi:hypothetical protein